MGNARDSFAEATVPRTRISTASCDFQCLFSPMGTRLTLTRLCELLACALGISYIHICICAHLHTRTKAQLYACPDMNTKTDLSPYVDICVLYMFVHILRYKCIGTICDRGPSRFFVQLPYSCFLTVGFVCNADCDFIFQVLLLGCGDNPLCGI